MFSCGACEPTDPTTDTVKVDIAAQVDADRQAAEEAQRRQQEAELELQRKRAEQEARCQKEAEEKAARERAEAEARRVLAERERQAEEARRAQELKRAEEARRREAEEAARRTEEERVAQEKRKAAVAAFLKEYGFTGVNAPRKKLMKTNYALHKAAKLGDTQLVEMLILEGADTKQKDSRGKTPAQVATAKNAKGSHIVVIGLLGGQSSQPTAGGA